MTATSYAAPRTRLDPRFSQSERALPWVETERLLVTAELYWISTVRADGRPHVTPVVGLWRDHRLVFCTGPTEQKAANLRQSPRVAVTTGANTWRTGVDVVVEGEAVRQRGRAHLQALADAYVAKYGEDWTFEAGEDAFTGDGGPAEVYAVEPQKVIAFAKHPHGQTTYLPG